MEHLDEGTVHAWLDGALSKDEGERIVAHVASCTDCSALVAEARGLIAASSRILSALDDVPRVNTDVTPTPPRTADLVVARGGASQAKQYPPRPRAWWTRPQLSAAAVLTIVAVSSLVVARNRESAIPDALRAPASAPASAPREGPALPAAPPAASNAESTQAPPAASRIAADAASSEVSAKATDRRPNAKLPAPMVPPSPTAPAREVRNEPLQLKKEGAAAPNEANKDVARDAGARSREAAVSSQGGANKVVAAPAVAPPPAPAKAVLDSTAAALAKTEGAMKRKDSLASSPARALADATSQRADSTARADQPQKVTRALDPERLAQIEKRRIQNEPKLENVVATGAASALPISPIRSADVVGCWTIQRSAAARAADIPERVELTARVVGRESGVEVRAARRVDARTQLSDEWRWMIGAHGDVTLIHVASGVPTRFPLLTTPDHRAADASNATRVKCEPR